MAGVREVFAPTLRPYQPPDGDRLAALASLQLVDQPVFLEQGECAVDRHAVHRGLCPLRPAQDLRRIQMVVGSLDHLQNGAPLPRQADAARGQLGL